MKVSTSRICAASSMTTLSYLKITSTSCSFGRTAPDTIKGERTDKKGENDIDSEVKGPQLPNCCANEGVRAHPTPPHPVPCFCCAGDRVRAHPAPPRALLKCPASMRPHLAPLQRCVCAGHRDDLGLLGQEVVAAVVPAAHQLERWFQEASKREEPS